MCVLQCVRGVFGADARARSHKFTHSCNENNNNKKHTLARTHMPVPNTHSSYEIIIYDTLRNSKTEMGKLAWKIIIIIIQRSFCKFCVCCVTVGENVDALRRHSDDNKIGYYFISNRL